MDINQQTGRPIYLRIVDDAMNRILTDEWLPDRRIPSVRELSVELGVNTHTVLKAFDILADEGIIISRRGMGYFLADDARERVGALRRREFYETTLPGLASSMNALGVTMADLAGHLEPLLRGEG
ncbi:MAG: GntR family transcriptional regulator [Pseudoflavonifractor sp.]|nr:GntR family transcriptional regulator [Alloprevotella sp.]MCM1117202.1 GntR family transcriptional regulator [Pseudoflavonifractor sp.]